MVCVDIDFSFAFVLILGRVGSSDGAFVDAFDAFDDVNDVNDVNDVAFGAEGRPSL